MSTTTVQRDFAARLQDAWDRFFFEPCGSPALARVRVAVGVAATLYAASWLADVVAWFGPAGLLPARLVRQMLAADGADSYRVSPLFLGDHPGWLYLWPVLGMVGGLLLATGWRARAGAALAWVAVLSLIHRGPAVAGPLEAVLAPLLFYFIWARSENACVIGRPPDASPTVSNRLGLRCVQLHMMIVCLGFGLAKHSVSAWQDGQAVWWLAGLRQQALLSGEWLTGAFWVGELWTHAAVAFELAFPVLVWVPATRRIMLVIGAAHWLLFAALTGHVVFCLLMAGGMLAWTGEPTTLRRRSA